MMMLEERITHLQNRIFALEQQQAISRVKAALALSGVYSYHIVKVPSNYYDLPLKERADILHNSSEEQLCKSIILQNSACRHQDISDITDSKFYCVIIQYHQRLNR
jgi:hypothetical protein